MVKVSFSRDGREFMQLEAVKGQLPDIQGRVDTAALLSFQPHSQRLGRKISVEEDSEEWARSLPAAYSRSDVEVTVLADAPTSPPPLATEAPPRPLLPADAAPRSFAVTEASSGKRTKLLLVIVVFLILVALAVVVLGGGSNNSNNKAKAPASHSGSSDVAPTHRDGLLISLREGNKVVLTITQPTAPEIEKLLHSEPLTLDCAAATGTKKLSSTFRWPQSESKLTVPLAGASSLKGCSLTVHGAVIAEVVFS